MAVTEIKDDAGKAVEFNGTLYGGVFDTSGALTANPTLLLTPTLTIHHNPEGKPLTLIGGSPDREYRYGDSSPKDIPWLSAVLDPVLYYALTGSSRISP